MLHIILNSGLPLLISYEIYVILVFLNLDIFSYLLRQSNMEREIYIRVVCSYC